MAPAATASSNGNGSTPSTVDPDVISVFQEVGLTGLNRASGIVREEFLQQLSGRKGVKVYKEMRDNDHVVGATIFCIDSLMRQVEWRVDEDDGDPDSVEFLKSVMHDMTHTWPEFISEIMSMLIFGWSLHEIVYKFRKGPAFNEDGTKNAVQSSKYTDGKIGWGRIPIRAQETIAVSNGWVFDANGDVLAFRQQPPPNYPLITIPAEKFLLFRTTTHKNNPEGRSVLRNAYRPWYFKKRIEEIEAIGIERDLAGFPMMYVDPKIMLDTASAEQKATFEQYKQLIRRIRRDEQEGAILPSVFDANNNQLYKLELLSSGGARQFDTSGIIERYNKAIAMVVLADFILLGHENVGSFALSSDKTDLFAVALGAWLDMIESVLNEQAVPRLFELNGLPTDNLPKIKHGDVETPDLTAIGGFITALVNAGAPLFPDDQLENWLRKIAGMPEKSEEAILAQQEQQDIAELAAQAQADLAVQNAQNNPQQNPQQQNPATTARTRAISVRYGKGGLSSEQEAS